MTTGTIFTRVGARVRKTLERSGLLAAAPADNTYHAFISYSHAVDSKLAPAVQRGLQRFAKPWHRPYALRIFRDETGLTANPHLWASIAAALDASRYFVLLASPEAARSPWVAREVEHWCDRKPPESILIAVTDGDVHWDAARKDFDWQQTTALPPALRGRFGEEPRWVDLRFARTTTDLSLANPAFRDAIADLGAPLHGVAKDTLVGEEVRQHRRTIRVARSAALTLLALTAAAVFLAVFAFGQRDQAVSARNTAISVGAAAEARSELVAGRLDQAILLALEATESARTPQAEDVLATVSQQTGPLLGFLEPHQKGPVNSLAFSPDGEALASAATDPAAPLAMWNTSTRRRQPSRPLVSPLQGGGRMELTEALAVRFSGDGRLLAAGADGGIVFLTSLARHGRPATRVLTLPNSGNGFGVQALAFDRADTTLASANNDGSVYLFDLVHPGRYATLQSGIRAGGVSSVFSADGSTLAVDDLSSGVITVWNVDARRRVATLADERSCGPATCSVPSITFGRGDNLLAVSRSDGSISVWDIARSSRRRLDVSSACGVPVLAFSPDGRTLAAGCGDGSIVLFDADRGTALTTLVGSGAVTALAFAPTAAVLASGSANGSVALWDVHRATTARTLEGGRGLAGIAFNADGTELAAAATSGRVLLWSVAGPTRRPFTLRTDRSTTLTAVEFGAGRTVRAVGTRDLTPPYPALPDLSTVWSTKPPYRPVTHELVGSIPGAGSYLGSFSRDATQVATPASGGAAVWNSARPRSAIRLESTGQYNFVDALAFSPDRTRLAAAESYGGSPPVSSRSGVVIWDLVHRRRIDTLEGTGNLVDYSSVAFSPDGKTLASGGTALTLWDAARGRRLADLIATPNVYTSAVAFSPDRRTLAYAAGDTITLWDVAERSEIATLTAPEPVTDILFSPNGAVLAAAGKTTITLWDASALNRALRGDVGFSVELLCPRVGRNLTQAEWSEFFPNRAYHRTCSSEPVPAGGG